MDDRSLTARRIPRWLLVLVALVATLATGITLGLSGVGPSDRPARGAAPSVSPPHPLDVRAEAAERPPDDARADVASPRDAATRLLDRRAAAFRAHDRAAYLATVDPRAAGFVSAQAAGFDNASRIPFASWEYDLVTPEAFALAPERRAELGGGAVFTAHVDLLFRIAGFDTAPVRSPQYLTFVQRDGTWYLAADTDGTGHDLHGTAQVWDLGPVDVLRNDLGIVLGVGAGADLASYQRDIATAVPDVAKVWGREWPGRAVVVVPGDQSQMARLLGAEPQKYARIAAVTTGERGAGADAAAADRIIVNPDAFRELGPVERRVVMTHEITHVASRAFTRNWTPTWLSEGFADYVGYLNSGQTIRTAAPELRRDVRDGKIPQDLPGDEQFETTHDALPQAYEMGWLACRLIAERWGEDKLVEFYRAVGASPPTGAGQPDQRSRLAAAFHAVLGVTPADFTRSWVGYVEEQVK